MVGISVGGTNSGLELGSIVAVAVGLGTEVRVGVAVVVIVGDGTGDAVVVTDGPHARDDKPMTMKINARKKFFIMIRSLGTLLNTLLPRIFYGQYKFIAK